MPPCRVELRTIGQGDHFSAKYERLEEAIMEIM